MSYRRHTPFKTLALAAALPVGLAASTAAAQIILPPNLIERPSNLVVQDLMGWLPGDYDQLLPGQNRTGWLAYSVAKQCGFNVWGPYEPVPYRIDLVQPGYWQNLGWGWFFDPGQRVSVGSGTIPLEEIVCTTDAWTYGFAPYEFNSDAVRQWAVDTLGAPTTWEIEFVVDPVSAESPDGDVWEDNNVDAPDYDTEDNTGVFTPADPYERIVPYTGTVQFGGVTTPATSLQADRITDDCPAGAAPVEITGSTVHLTPAADGSFPPLDVTMVDPTCASLSLAASGLAYDLVVQSGGGARQRIDGTLGGVPASIAVELTASGIVPFDARTPLPRGHSMHFVDERVPPFERPEPYGYPYVYFPRADDVSVTDLSLVGYTLAEPRYLHIRGIPFSIRAENWTLDSAGLLAAATGTHYNHNQPFGELDLRASKPPRSNDNRYWGAPAFIAQPLSITSSGATLPAALGFGGATATAHFPVVSTRFESFTATVTNGRLSTARSGFTPTSLRPVAFTLSAGCPECGATSGLKRGYSLQADSDWGVSSNGDAAIKVADLSNAMWGPAVTDGGATKAVFERIGENAPDQTGVVVVPGHYLVGTEDAGRTAADYLLGAFTVGNEAGSAQVQSVRLNGSYEAKRGNGFFAGLTVGPQTLRNIIGQPTVGYGNTLAGTRTRIAFGGPAGAGGTPPTFGEIEANVGTKLVVRPGGVTGVFNTTTTGASLPQPQVYGYDMSFDRFAFRMVANAMDTVSWVDGRVSLPGRAGFSTGFESLQILCSGDLGGGLLDADESRRKRLVAWKAPYDLRSLGFVPPPGAGLCDDGDRVFETGGEATVAALREALELKTQWYNNGEPAGVSITGKTQNELDRVSSDKRGFLAEFKPSGVTLGGVPFNTSVGWFGLEGKVLVPFWKAPGAYVRVENVAGAGGRRHGRPDARFPAGLGGGFPGGVVRHDERRGRRGRRVQGDGHAVADPRRPSARRRLRVGRHRLRVRPAHRLERRPQGRRTGRFHRARHQEEPDDPRCQGRCSVRHAGEDAGQLRGERRLREAQECTDQPEHRPVRRQERGGHRELPEDSQPRALELDQDDPRAGDVAAQSGRHRDGRVRQGATPQVPGERDHRRPERQGALRRPRRQALGGPGPAGQGRQGGVRPDPRGGGPGPRGADGPTRSGRTGRLPRTAGPGGGTRSTPSAPATRRWMRAPAKP